MIKLQTKLYYIFTDYFNATLLIYLPLFLKNRFNYDGSQLGTILFVAGIFAIIGILVGPRLVNKFNKEKSVIIIEFIALLLALILIMNTSNFYLIAFATGLTYLCKMAMYSIGDNFIADLSVQNDMIYAKQRSFGSIGWGLCFFLNGFLVMSYPTIFIIVWAVLIVLAIINLLLLKEEPKEEKLASLVSIATFKEIAKNKKTVFYLLIIMCVYMITQTQPNFLNFFVQEIGGSVEKLSVATASFVIIEFTVMFYAQEIRKKMSDRTYLNIIVLLLMLKTGLVCIATKPILVYASVIIDPMVFGLLLPFNTLYLKESVSSKYNSTVLSIYGMASLFLIAIYSKFAGNLMNMFDSRAVFISLFILTIVLFISLQVYKIDNHNTIKEEI